LVQGVLGVFLREPLADWQREARLLQTGASVDAEEEYISLKASLLSTLHWMTQALLLVIQCQPVCLLRQTDFVRTTEQVCNLLQVAFAKRRLSGDHPAELTVAELATRHKHKQHWPALQACCSCTT
jgi:hypothetical protein